MTSNESYSNPFLAGCKRTRELSPIFDIRPASNFISRRSTSMQTNINMGRGIQIHDSMTSQSRFVISQEESSEIEMDRVDMDMYVDEHMHHPKRIRRCDSHTPLSPSVASVTRTPLSSTPNGSNCLELQIHIDMGIPVHVDETTKRSNGNSNSNGNNAEWWKAKHNFRTTASTCTSATAGRLTPLSLNSPTNTLDTIQSSRCCFVCECASNSTSLAQATNKPTTNSLLEYFPSSFKTASQVSTASASLEKNSCRYQVTLETLIECSFCERQACSACTRSCERCVMNFCTFCSCIDYNGKNEKSFCLDCQALEGREAHSQDTDRMQVD